MKVCLAGEGAFGTRHLEAMAKIPEIEVVTLAGGVSSAMREVAEKYGIPHWSADLDECLAQPGVEAAVLTTPTPIHARQAVQCLKADKHVMVEIPMADSLADSEWIVRTQQETGLIAMAGHTRRFNPHHQWIHRRIA